MSERTILHGFHIGVEHQKEPQSDDDGRVQTVDVWTLVFTEINPPTQNQYLFSFNRDTRDEVVRKLTGGVVLAGGELPRLP